MIFDGSKVDTDEIREYNLPNGACAVLDSNDKIVAYNRNGVPDRNDWSWVRKDCQKN